MVDTRLNKFFFLVSVFIFCISLENGTFRIVLAFINLMATSFLFFNSGLLITRKLTIPIIFLSSITIYYFFEKVLRGSSYSFHFYVAILSLLSAIFLISYIRNSNSKAIFSRLLEYMLAFHTLLFFVQFFLWHMVKIDLDYLYYLGVESNPHRSGFYGSYRATGIFSEPSIYSTYIIAIISIKYCIDGRISKFMLMGLCSMLLSFSTMALIQAFCFVLFTYFRASLKSFFILLFSCFVIFISFSDSLFSRLELYSNGEDSSNMSKLIIIEKWWSNDSLIKYGYSYIDKFKEGPEYIALGDLTFWMNNYLFFGLYIGSFFLFLYVSVLFERKLIINRMLFSIVLFKLSTFTFPLTSLVLCFYFYPIKSDK